MEFLFAAIGVAVALAMILGARKRNRRVPPRAEDASPSAQGDRPRAGESSDGR